MLPALAKLDESPESSGNTHDVPAAASLLPIAIKLEYPAEMEVDASAACSQEDDAPHQRSFAPPVGTHEKERERGRERGSSTPSLLSTKSDSSLHP